MDAATKQKLQDMIEEVFDAGTRLSDAMEFDSMDVGEAEADGKAKQAMLLAFIEELATPRPQKPIRNLGGRIDIDALVESRIGG